MMTTDGIVTIRSVFDKERQLIHTSPQAKYLRCCIMLNFLSNFIPLTILLLCTIVHTLEYNVNEFTFLFSSTKTLSCFPYLTDIQTLL